MGKQSAPTLQFVDDCKAAVIYEGTRDIHTLMQADWALGLKKEKPARKSLPPWKAPESLVRGHTEQDIGPLTTQAPGPPRASLRFERTAGGRTCGATNAPI